jgi:hypothetical protein
MVSGTVFHTKKPVKQLAHRDLILPTNEAETLSKKDNFIIEINDIRNNYE